MTKSISIGIVGGGPVGLYLALRLSQNKKNQITIFEKKDWPVDKVCGQGIMPSGRKRLEKNGVEFSLQESFKFTGIHYYSGSKELKGELSSPGIGVERSALSLKLLGRLKQETNIELKPKHSVSHLDILVDGKIQLKANEIECQFDYLFCCDGLHSKMRDFLGHTKERSGDLRMGARIHYDIAPWENSVQVYWRDGIEAYITPVSNSKIEVAYLWYESAFEKGPKIEERLKDYFPVLHSKLDDSKKTNDFKAYGPFKKYSDVIADRNAFFVGDAYCFKDGITGEGISLGFKSADILADNFLDLKRIHLLHIYLLYLNYRFWIYIALRLSRLPWFRELTFSVFKRIKSLFNLCLNLNDYSFEFLKRFY